MLDGTCGTCFYFCGYDIGGCQKHAPVMCHDGKDKFPMMHESGWCGDYKPRECGNELLGDVAEKVK